MPTAVVEKTSYTARLVVPFMGAAVADSTKLPTTIELVKAGQWLDSWKGDVSITETDLQEMKTNFDAGVGLPGRGMVGLPIDFSHEDWEKAGGWIKQLDVRPDENGDATLYSINTEWTKSGAEALMGGEFKCISPSFWPRCFGEWCDPEDPTVRASNVLVGAGLTNVPFFKDLKALTASRDDSRKGLTMYVKEDKGVPSMPTLDQVRVKDAASLTDEEKTLIKASTADLSDAEKTKFASILQAATPTEDADLDDAKKIQADIKSGAKVLMDASEVAKLKASAGEVDSLKASVKTLEDKVNASEKVTVEKEVDEHIARGAIIADQKDVWVQKILADSSARDLLKGIPSNKVVADSRATGADGTDLGGAEETLHAKVVAARNDKNNKGKSYSQLRSEVLASDPTLAAQIKQGEEE